MSLAFDARRLKEALEVRSSGYPGPQGNLGLKNSEASLGFKDGLNGGFPAARNVNTPRVAGLQLKQADRFVFTVARESIEILRQGCSVESSTSGVNHEDRRHRRHRPDRLEDRRHSAPGRPRGRRRLAQSGINSITGEGLNEAMAGAQVVIDLTNSPSF